MKKVDYFISGDLMRCHDAAIVLDGDDPLATLIETAIQTISTDVMIECGGHKMHLAAWQDPDHWSDAWAEQGVEADDVAGLVAAEVAEGD